MTQWIDACATDDIETKDMIRFDHAGRRFIIYRSPDHDFFCTDGICTHEHSSAWSSGSSRSTGSHDGMPAVRG